MWVAWREGTLTRAKELEALCYWVKPTDTSANDEVLRKAIRRHLDAARQAARVDPLKPRRRFRILRNGPLIERATSNLDAAEAHLLNLAPDDDTAAARSARAARSAGYCSLLGIST